MKKIRVLFLCVHNSARSQMAEALLKKIAGDRFEVFSAGLEPGKLNPLAVKVMDELKIDISKNRTKSVGEFLQRELDYVITVCDQSNAQRCPFFPGDVKRLHWSFPDPSGLTGSEEEKLVETRKIRDAIHRKVKEFVKQF